MLSSDEFVINNMDEVYVLYYLPIMNELPLHVKVCIIGS